MANPDYMQIASAYGIPSRRVSDRKELEDAVREMFITDGPFLLEANCMEEECVMPMIPYGNAVDDIICKA